LSDKVIKATNVKLVGRPAETAVPHHRTHPGGTGGHVSPSGIDGSVPVGDRHGVAEGIAQVKRDAYEKGLSDGREFRKKEFAQMLGTMAEATRQAGELKKKLYLEAEEQIL